MHTTHSIGCTCVISTKNKNFFKELREKFVFTWEQLFQNNFSEVNICVRTGTCRKSLSLGMPSLNGSRAPLSTEPILGGEKHLGNYCMYVSPTARRETSFCERKEKPKSNRNSSKSSATFVDATLVFGSIFCTILFFWMVGAPAKQLYAFIKAATIPAQQHNENTGPSSISYIYFYLAFNASPHYRIFSIFDLSTKAAFAKMAFDTAPITMRNSTRSSHV